MMVDQFLPVLIKKSELQKNVNLTTRQAKNTAKLSFCLICNAEARIINYGALSCYSCKTFFRRHSFRTKVCIFYYICK
jgi:hypothetical protein